MSLGVYLENQCPHCGVLDKQWVTDGITDNLMPMFREAGWDHLAYDDYTGEKMQPIARDVLAKLKARPEHFQSFEPSSGWGTYADALWFFEKLAEMCEKFPKYKLKFSR